MTHLLRRGKQDVAGCKVAMDEVVGLEVCHACGNLDGVLTQGRDEVAMTVSPQSINESSQRRQLCHLECSINKKKLYINIQSFNHSKDSF